MTGSNSAESAHSLPPDETPAAAASAPLDDAQASDTSTAADATNDQELSPQAEIAKLETDLAEANDRMLRAQAEFENFRKRSRRELEDERRFALASLLRDLLTVVDNLDRAIDAAEKDASNAGLLEGVKLVSSQLAGILQQNNCQRIQAVGATFDPHLHEAIGHEPTSEYPPNTVTRETQAGYQLHDRVIRPAQVLIAAPPVAPNAN